MQPRAWTDVLLERQRQDSKWGEQNHQPFEWLSVLGEEVGETCQAANQAHYNGQPWHRYRTELVHVAAVALAAVECMDRKGREATLSGANDPLCPDCKGTCAADEGGPCLTCDGEGFLSLSA